MRSVSTSKFALEKVQKVGDSGKEGVHRMVRAPLELGSGGWGYKIFIVSLMLFLHFQKQCYNKHTLLLSAEKKG